jgi:hypothetical protein
VQSANPPLLAYAISGVLLIVVLYFRMRRLSKPRRLRIGTLWIIPALFLLITVGNFVGYPPSAGDIPWLVVAFALGAVLGWQRGKLMKIWVAPEGGELMMQGSPWAIIFLVVLILLRMLLRGGLALEADSWAISPALINDGFVIFALGLFGVMRVEMALRAVKLGRQAAA